MIRVNGSNFDLIWENSDGGGSIGSSGANRPFNMFLKSFQECGEIVTPSNPPANNHRLYFKSDGNLYMLDSTGAESQVNGGGGGGGANTTLSNLVSPTAINQNLNFDTGKVIADTTPVTAIDVNNRQLVESGATATLDWQNHTLKLGSSIVMDWGVQNLYDLTAHISVDWFDRQLRTVAGSAVIDWKNQIANDNSGSNAIDWQNRLLIDNIGNTSIDWQNRILYDDATNAIVQLNSTNPYGAPALVDNSNNASIDWVGRLLIDSGGNGIVDWQNYSIAAPSGIVWNINSGRFLDLTGVRSINIDTRIAQDNSSINSINWTNRTLFDNGGNISVDWDGRSLTDGNHNPAASWNAGFQIQLGAFNRNVYSSTSNFTISDNQTWIFLNYTTGTQTITFPQTPVDGQLLLITTSGGVSSLTLDPSPFTFLGTPPTSIDPDSPIRYMWIPGTAAWTRW